MTEIEKTLQKALALDAKIICIDNNEFVKVIRCRNCRWFNTLGCAIDINDDTDKPGENDYCSFADEVK